MMILLATIVAVVFAQLEMNQQDYDVLMKLYDDWGARWMLRAGQSGCRPTFFVAGCPQTKCKRVQQFNACSDNNGQPYTCEASRIVTLWVAKQKKKKKNEKKEKPLTQSDEFVQDVSDRFSAKWSLETQRRFVGAQKLVRWLNSKGQIASSALTRRFRTIAGSTNLITPGRNKEFPFFSFPKLVSWWGVSGGCLFFVQPLNCCLHKCSELFTNRDLRFNLQSDMVSRVPGLTRLAINSCGLEGTLPTELSRLTALSSIEIVGNNGLGGTIPSQFGQMRKLKELFLNDNKLVGTIPSELFQLQSLRAMWVFHRLVLLGSTVSHFAQKTVEQPVGWRCAASPHRRRAHLHCSIIARYKLPRMLHLCCFIDSDWQLLWCRIAREWPRAIARSNRVRQSHQLRRPRPGKQ